MSSLSFVFSIMVLYLLTKNGHRAGTHRDYRLHISIKELMSTKTELCLVHIKYWHFIYLHSKIS